MNLLFRIAKNTPSLVGLLFITLLLVVAVFAPQICDWLGIDPYSQEILARFSPPDETHILGTDESGRDFFARLLYGARVSIGVALFSALVSAVIGSTIGILAGYYGSWTDTLLMRFTDMLLSLPLLPVMILLAATDFTKIPYYGSFFSEEDSSVLKLVIILVSFSWMTVARLVRGQTLKLRKLEFIQAARSLGMRDSQILLKHIFPCVIPTVCVAVTLTVGQQILFESALSFLGLGIQPPLATWGNMLNNAIETLRMSPLLVVLPGLLILLVVLSFNFLGDGLEYALDPKSKK